MTWKKLRTKLVDYAVYVIVMTPILIVAVLMIPFLIFPAVRHSIYADSIYEATIGEYKRSRKHKKGPTTPEDSEAPVKRP